MSRTAPVKILMPQSLVDLKPCEGPGYKILDEVEDFLTLSTQLIATNSSHLIPFFEKFLSHHLLYSGSGKALYQQSLQVSKANGEKGLAWYEIYRDRFHPLSETNVAWTRMNRAMHRIILIWGAEITASRHKEATEEDRMVAAFAYEEASNKFEVNLKELQLLCNWYFTRVGENFENLAEVIQNPKKAKLVVLEKTEKPEETPETEKAKIPAPVERRRADWNIGEQASDWWDGEVCCEHSRYILLRQPIIEHASRKLATPSFKYLAEIYEDRSVILEELYEIAWPAILVTSHRSDISESLRMAKSYINTRIHHLATRYTRDLKKQEWNAETESYESMEIPMFSDPDMDPSKHQCLIYEESEYSLQELLVSMEKHLNPKEFGVVSSLMRLKQDPEFEAFAETQPDRRLAAFQFYEVHESDLKKVIFPFIGKMEWAASCFA